MHFWLHDYAFLWRKIGQIGYNLLVVTQVALPISLLATNCVIDNFRASFFDTVLNAVNCKLMRLGRHWIFHTIDSYTLDFGCDYGNNIISLAFVFIVDLANNPPERLVTAFAIRDLDILGLGREINADKPLPKTAVFLSKLSPVPFPCPPSAAIGIFVLPQV